MLDFHSNNSRIDIIVLNASDKAENSKIFSAFVQSVKKMCNDTNLFINLHDFIMIKTLITHLFSSKKSFVILDTFYQNPLKFIRDF